LSVVGIKISWSSQIASTSRHYKQSLVGTPCQYFQQGHVLMGFADRFGTFLMLFNVMGQSLRTSAKLKPASQQERLVIVSGIT
jgi:hypothetical protein